MRQGNDLDFCLCWLKVMYCVNFFAYSNIIDLYFVQLFIHGWKVIETKEMCTAYAFIVYKGKAIKQKDLEDYILCIILKCIS